MRFVQVAANRLYRTLAPTPPATTPVSSWSPSGTEKSHDLGMEEVNNPRTCPDPPPSQTDLRLPQPSFSPPYQGFEERSDGSAYCQWGLHDPITIAALSSRFPKWQWTALLRAAKLPCEQAILRRHTLATCVQKIAHHLFLEQSNQSLPAWPLFQGFAHHQLTFVWQQLSQHCYQPLLPSSSQPIRQQLLAGRLSPRQLLGLYAEQMTHWSTLRYPVAYPVLQSYFTHSKLAALFEQLVDPTHSPLTPQEQTALLEGRFSPAQVTDWLVDLSHQQAEIFVVGAGAAGVAAADHLQRCNRQVVLLEACEQVGGRTQTHTQDLAAAIDLGAEYLHSSQENPAAHLAQSLGLPCIALTKEQTLAFGFEPEQAPSQQAAQLLQVRTALDEQLRQGPPEQDGCVAHNLPPTLDKWQQAALAQICPLEMGVEAEQLSLLDLRRIMPERTADAWIPAGLGTMIQLFSFGLPVHCQHRVEHITYDEQGVILQAKGRRWQGDYAIVTVPLGLLQQGAINFRPPLPPSHLEAILGLQMAHYEKVILQFLGDPFPTIAPGTYAYLQDQPGQWMDVMFKPPMVSHGQQEDSPYTLVIAYLGGSFAKAMAGQSERAIEHVLTCLSRHVQRSLHHDLHRAITTDWVTQSGGAYTAAPPHGFAFRRQLAEPIANRLFFAGEACDIPLADATTWATQVPGAMRSGEAAAKRIVAHAQALCLQGAPKSTASPCRNPSADPTRCQVTLA